MGTRHLIIVFYKGVYRVAQYGQWDGYPKGQGVIVLAFVRDPANIAKLKATLDTPGRLFTPSHVEIMAWLEQDQRRHDEHREKAIDDYISDRKPAPVKPIRTICRDTGAKILQLVADATEPIPIVTEITFISDTLFCEWAYVVDLDAEILEIYAGLYMREQQTRFGEAEGVSKGGGPSLIASWKLDKLPDEPEFLRVCHVYEEDHI